jgi:hypothetical protein
MPEPHFSTRRSLLGAIPTCGTSSTLRTRQRRRRRRRRLMTPSRASRRKKVQRRSRTTVMPLLRPPHLVIRQRRSRKSERSGTRSLFNFISGTSGERSSSFPASTPSLPSPPFLSSPPPLERQLNVSLPLPTCPSSTTERRRRTFSRRIRVRRARGSGEGGEVRSPRRVRSARRVYGGLGAMARCAFSSLLLSLSSY